MIQKTNTWQLRSLLCDWGWIAGLWLLVSGCQPDKNAEVVHDAKWRADSIQLQSVIDKLLTEGNRKSTYENFLQKLPVFNSVSVCKAHPDIAVTYFSWALLDTDGFNPQKGQPKTIWLLGRFQQLADSAENERLIVWAEYFIARFYNNHLDEKVSLPRLLALDPKFKSLNDSLGMTLVAKRVGQLYFEVYHDYQRALPYYQKAANLTHDTIEMELLASRIAEVHLNLGNTDSARFYAKYVTSDLRHPILELQLIVSDFKNDSGVSERQIQSAFTNFSHRLDSLPYDVFIGSFWKATLDVSAVFLKLGQLDVARKYVAQALRHDTSCRTCDFERAELYGLNSSIYYAAKDYQNAYKWADKEVRAIKVLGDKKGKEKMEATTLRYEVEQLVKNQEVRSQRMKQEADTELEEQRLFRNVSVLVGFCFLFIAALVVYLARLRRRIEIEKLRSSISRDLHDDIGSTLSSIKIISGMALRKTLENNPSQESLYRIYDRSQRLLENMHDLVWSLKPSNDSLGEIFARMRLFAATVFEAKEIDYQVDFPVELDKTQLSMAGKHALYNIFKELVNNIAKHAEASTVSIRIILENKLLHLVVEDNGNGFDMQAGEEQKESLGGNGLAGIEARAKTIGAEFHITTQPGRGTKAELKLPV